MDILATLLLITNLSCPPTKMINESSERWTERDLKSMDLAKDGCVKHYGSDYCLSKFIKKAPLTYWAICKDVE